MQFKNKALFNSSYLRVQIKSHPILGNSKQYFVQKWKADSFNEAEEKFFE